MAVIRVFAGETFRFEIALDEGTEYVAGSGPESAIVVDDPRVSPCHCVFTLRDGSWVVKDRGSRLGTFVNGQKCVARPLAPDDRIAVGTYTLEFRNDIAVAKKPVYELALESTDTSEADSAPASTADANRDNGQSPQRKGRAMVLVMESPRRRAVPLERQVTLIGKGSHCDLRVSGWFVKDEQAAVVKDRSCCRIICQGGIRPVRVNGDRVREILLQEGDVITVAGNTISFKTL